MSTLNEYNEKTKKVIHILITTLCNRNCKYCCNKQYDLNDVPYVTDEELKNAETICLTGGEPFLFCNSCEIARYYKLRYPNIRHIYVYTNAVELAQWLDNNEKVYAIYGVSVSIKTTADAYIFEKFIRHNESITNLDSNLLYVFDDLYSDLSLNFTPVKRKWQVNFKPSDDSIFRKC